MPSTDVLALAVLKPKRWHEIAANALPWRSARLAIAFCTNSPAVFAGAFRLAGGLELNRRVADAEAFAEVAMDLEEQFIARGAAVEDEMHG